MSHPKIRRYWTFRYFGEEKLVRLIPIQASNVGLLSSIPDHGVWSRIHEPIDVVTQFVPDTEETFQIDGGWELGEFSQLYGKLEDVYYILNDIRRWSNLDQYAPERATISSAFEKPWRGGGSYVSFYTDVANDNEDYSQLRMGGIKYNSPGFVKIRAKREAFNGFIEALDGYAENIKASKSAYYKLNHFMSTSGLLRSYVKSYVTAETKLKLEELSINLSRYLRGASFDVLTEMAGRDSVIAAKVLMSIYRRVEGLYKFFQQGRIAHHEIG